MKADVLGRRTFSPQWKMNIVDQATTSSRSVSLIARENNINTNQVFRWIREVKKGQSRWVRVAMGMQSLPHQEEPAAFLPVIPSPLKQPAPASTSITVELTTGHRVTVNQADEQIVRLLLLALL